MPTARRPHKKTTKARATAKSIVRVRLVASRGGGGTTASSSSAGGGGAAGTVVIPQLPTPSTALPTASPLGSPGVEDLRRTITRLEREAAVRAEEATKRAEDHRADIERLRGTVHDLRGATLADLTAARDSIDRHRRETGATVGDIRGRLDREVAERVRLGQQTGDALNQAQAAVGRVQGGLEGLAAAAGTEIANANQRIVGLQQETGAVGRAVLATDAQRQADSQTLAAEVIRAQQAASGVRGDLNNLAAITGQEVGRNAQRIGALQGEIGAVGEAVLNADAQRVADSQTIASELVRTQQGLAETDRLRQQGDVRLEGAVRNIWEQGQGLSRATGGLFRDIYSRFQGSPAEVQAAGGLAALRGGASAQLVTPGFGQAGGFPQITQMVDDPSIPRLVGPNNQLTYMEEDTTTPRLVGPSNQIENGSADMSDL